MARLLVSVTQSLIRLHLVRDLRVITDDDYRHLIRNEILLRHTLNILGLQRGDFPDILGKEGSVQSLEIDKVQLTDECIRADRISQNEKTGEIGLYTFQLLLRRRLFS